MPRPSRAPTTLPAYQPVDTSPPPRYSAREPRPQRPQPQPQITISYSSTPSAPPSRWGNYDHYHPPSRNEQPIRTSERVPLLSDKPTRRTSVCRDFAWFIVGVFVTAMIFCLFLSQPWRKSKLTSFWYDIVPAQTCHSVGAREYSATLANIPNDWDPLEACEKTVLSVHGKRVRSPPVCSVITINDSTLVQAKWIVNFAESECLPLWSPINSEKCVSYGVRPYHADLAYLPPGLDALAACRDTPVVINEHSVRPTHCELLIKEDETLGPGPLVVARGHWNVEEASCAPKWVLNTDSQCFAYNKRRYTAVLTGIPEELDPLETCYQAPLHLLGSDRQPESCDWDGAGRVIGTWYSGDAYCRPVLKDIQNYGCLNKSGLKRFESEVVDIHGDWYRLCTTTPYRGYFPAQCQSRRSWFVTRYYALYDIPSLECY